MSKVASVFTAIVVAAVLFSVAWFGSGAKVIDLSQASEEFLSIDEAFAMHVSVTGDQIRVHWDIYPGYYLYQERMLLESASDDLRLGEAKFDREGEMKDDPTFGPQRVYFDAVELSSQIIGTTAEEIKVQVEFQGCAESGLCYPPTTRTRTLVYK